MRTRLQKISKYRPSVFQGKMNFAVASRRGITLTAEHPAERMMLRILLSALLGLALAYLYFVGASVLNVIARKEALAQTASLATAVAVLERDYFAASQAVSPSQGAQLGLAPVATTAYVYRPSILGDASQAQHASLVRSRNEI